MNSMLLCGFIKYQLDYPVNLNSKTQILFLKTRMKFQNSFSQKLTV